VSATFFTHVSKLLLFKHIQSFEIYAVQIVTTQIGKLMIFHFLGSEYIVKNFSFKICMMILLPVLSVRNAVSSTNTRVAAEISRVDKSAP